MTVFKIEWHTNKKNLLVWTFSLSVIVIGFMSIFPSMDNAAMTDMMTTKLASLPENMLKAFHLNSGPSLVEPTGFFAYLFQYLFIAASMYAIMLGNKMLVKEEINVTIDYLYAQPISRRQIMSSKVIASISMLTSFWLVTFLSSLSVTLVVNHGKSTAAVILSDISKIFLTEFIVLVFFLGIGFLLSSLLKQLNQGLSMGIVFIFYLLGIVGDLKEELSLFSKFSPMAQAGPAAILEKEINVTLIVGLLIISFLLFWLTLYVYERKDLEV